MQTHWCKPDALCLSLIVNMLIFNVCLKKQLLIEERELEVTRISDQLHIEKLKY